MENNALNAVKLKDCKTKQEDSKTFQKRYKRDGECFRIPNLVNSKVAKIIEYQPHGGQITLFLRKVLK